VPFTFLRGSVCLEVLQYAVGPEETIHSPRGDGRFGPSRDDVARVAAVLEWPGSHTGQTYDITGPVTISFLELAQAFHGRAGRRSTMQTKTLRSTCTEVISASRYRRSGACRQRESDNT
jgi:hypothetical protein